MRGIVLSFLLTLSLVFAPMVGAKAAAVSQSAHHQVEHCHGDTGPAKASVPQCHLCVCAGCPALVSVIVAPKGAAVRVHSQMSLIGPDGLSPLPLPRPPLV